MTDSQLEQLRESLLQKSMEFASGGSGASVRAVVAAAARGAGSEHGEDIALAVERGGKRWRDQYTGHLLDVQELMLSSAATCEQVAGAGLAALHREMLWHGKPLRELDVAAAASPGHFGTGVVEGTRASPEAFRLPVPRESAAATAQASVAARHAGIRVRSGAKDVLAEVRAWVREGLAEPNVAEAMAAVLLDRPEALDLRGQYFVVLGAGSQMGPTKTLLSLGATVVAVELPSSTAAWEDLFAFTRASAGRLLFPTRPGSGDSEDGPQGPQPGADVVEDLPNLASWIATEAVPSDARRLVVGSYLYLDGANFVRVAAASDFLGAAVRAMRPEAVLAYLCSPTEPYCVPAAAVSASAEASRTRMWTHPADGVLRAASLGSALLPNEPAAVPESGLWLQDCYTPEQGPNYAFAKLIQRWRAVEAGPSGAVAAVAPASLTRSVMSTPMVKMGILGCARFGIVPFLPETANAIMTALLVHDLSPEAQPRRREAFAQNPLVLLQQSAVHGGTWRSPFKTSSTTKISVIVHAVNRFQHPAAHLALGATGVMLFSSL